MFTASKRALVGDLNYSLTEVGLSFNLDVEANELTWSTLDSDERVIIALRLSLDEFVALASAIDVGRDIAFGEESVNLWEIWTKAMTSICAALIDCLENDEDVKSALSEAIQDLGYPSPSTTNPVGLGKGAENMLEGVACDNNTLYGACVAIVDYIHDIAQDFIVTFITAASNNLKLARLIDFIPVIGDLPIADDLNDLITWLTTEAYIDFDAGYTTDLRQDLICYMFERACGDCELSPFDVVSAYAANGGVPMNPEDTYEAFLTALTSLTAEQAVACGLCGMVAAALASNASVLGLVGLRGLKTIARTGNPDGDWEIFCDECIDEPDDLPTCLEWNDLSGDLWNITFEYIGTMELPTEVDNSFGNNAPSGRAGFVVSGSNHGRYINVRVNFTEPMRVQYAGMQYWYQDDGNDSPRRRISLFDAGGTALANQQLDTSGAPKGAWTNHEWSGDVSGVWYIDFSFRHWGTNTAIYNADDMSAFLDNICMEVEPVAEDATPILNPVVCAGGGVGGTGLTHNGGTSWTITTTTASVDTRAMIKDIYGRAFILSNIDFTGINPTKSVGWDTACFIENGDTLGGRTLTEAGWTWALGRTDAITFDMVLA